MQSAHKQKGYNSDGFGQNTGFTLLRGIQNLGNYDIYIDYLEDLVDFWSR